MPKVPSMSSKDLVRLLGKGGAVFVRQGSTDHAIYSRVIEGRRYVEYNEIKNYYKKITSIPSILLKCFLSKV